MPIYEYLCDDCGTKFEKLVRRDTDVNCPSCDSAHLSQQLSTFSAHANTAAPSKSQVPSCPGGMCKTPGLCGMN